MTDNIHQIDWTKWVGITAFSVTAFTHFLVSISKYVNTRLLRQYWFGMSALYSIFSIDIVFNMRHTLLRKYVVLLISEGKYNDRRPAQLAALILIIGIIIWLAIRNFNSKLDMKTKFAILLSIFSVFLFSSEIISLHQLDAIIYKSAGPILLIGWLWVFCTLVATVIALSIVIRRLYSTR